MRLKPTMKRLLIGKRYVEVLPNEPNIIVGPNNHKLTLRSAGHSKMKQCQMLVQLSSSSLSLTTISLLTSTSRKRNATLDTSAGQYKVLFQGRAPM